MNIDSMIDGLEKAAAESIRAKEGDYYGDDGLLYCGNCKTKKQTRVNILGKERTPFCLCRCEAEKRDREEAERKRIEFERRVKELRRTGFPESDMQEWTFANDDGENSKIMTVAKNYVDNFGKMREDGKGLLFFGPVGTGKTYAAACIVNALIDKGCPCMMAKISDIADGIFKGKFTCHDFNSYPLLVLDDLAAERKTEYMQEIVYNVIDARCRANLPLIITTNLTADELKHPADITNQRTFSRLFEMCIPIEITGDDRRRKKLKEDFNTYKDILGI